VEQLESRIATRELDDKALAALTYAAKLSRAAPLPHGADRNQLLAQGFSPEEHRELAFVVAATELANRVHTITAVPPRPLERLASGWLPALLRLTAARRAVRLRRRGCPRNGGAREATPYADLRDRFAGTPIGTALEETLEAMAKSTVLPNKVRALVFAVIAHALDCGISAAEARAMLPKDVALDDFAELLAHLGGPSAEPMEREVASFVRETIWYSPLAVQRRARALQQRLSGAAFLEVVALACLANSLCRLAAAVSRE
jgi:alkylhydroperoxidase family enzyme